jgi:PLP dependent protein
MAAHRRGPGVSGPSPPDAGVPARLEAVRDRIARAGGDPDRVTVVAVTKGHPVETVRDVLAAGLADLGESYAQEMVAKLADLDAGPPPDGPQPRWHLVGRLQRNKVRQLASHVALWQSVDREPLAAEIAKRAPGAAVLVQVDVTGEPTKGGCPPSEAAALVDRCRALGLDVQGLMALGPTDDPDGARPAFARLARLADELGLPERSMGMSDDLEAAVAEGSTMVRVGTALVGPRSGARGVGH